MKKLLIILIGMLLLGQGGCIYDTCSRKERKRDPIQMNVEYICTGLKKIKIILSDKNTDKNLLDTGVLAPNSIFIEGLQGNSIPFFIDSTAQGKGLSIQWETFLCDTLINHFQEPLQKESDKTISYRYKMFVNYKENNYPTDTISLNFVKFLDRKRCLFYEEFRIEAETFPVNKDYIFHLTSTKEEYIIELIKS